MSDRLATKKEILADIDRHKAWLEKFGKMTLGELTERCSEQEATITRLREEQDAARKEAEYRGICELCTHAAVRQADALREAARKMCMLCDDRVRGHCFDTCPLYEWRDQR